MLLEAKAITKEYLRGRKTFAAVHRADFALESGDFASILGRSGSGKTTLLNLFAGLLRPTTGSVTLEGLEVSALGEAQSARLRNQRIGIVPQGHSALANLSVLDNVLLPFYLLPRQGNAEQKAAGLLQRLGIDHLAQSRPRELSGGELRRVAIARALINDPVLLLADEPTGDLDAATTVQVLELFRELAQRGVAVLVVTHDRDVLRYSDNAYTMDAGRLQPLEAISI